MLDCIYVFDSQYTGVKVGKSSVKSDHLAIVAYTFVVKTARVGKTRRVCTYRKLILAPNAHFLTSVSALIHTITALLYKNPFVNVYAQDFCSWKCQTSTTGLSHFSETVHTAPSLELGSLSYGR